MQKKLLIIVSNYEMEKNLINNNFKLLFFFILYNKSLELL